MTATPTPERAHLLQILKRLFADLPLAFDIALWTGETVRAGNGDPTFTITVRHPSAVAALLNAKDPLRVVDGYLTGRLEVDGSLERALALKEHLGAVRLRARDRLRLGWHGLKLGRFAARAASGLAARADLATHDHTRRADSEAVQFHYDVSNDFYRLWLDDEMVYSCAYFESGTESLDEAQYLKLRHICRKLRLQPHDRFLDVGCGWGALVRHAATHFGVQAQGITLSEQQLQYATRRAETSHLQQHCHYALRDYRDVPGTARFDKVASVGMFEHVGLRNLPTYFESIHRLLKPGGLFLNHGITHDQDGWPDTLGTRFINRYVFPGGELDRVGNVIRVMEQAGFEILDVECLRPHYARTLRAWVDRLQQRWEEASAIVAEPTLRLWRLYMFACALEFESGSLGVYQILASKRDAPPADVPLNRKDLYA